MVLGDTLEEKVSGCSVRQKNEHTNLPYKADATEDTEKLDDQRTQPSLTAFLGQGFPFLGKEHEL